MKAKNGRLVYGMLLALMAAIVFPGGKITSAAAEKDYLDTLNTGIAAVLESDSDMTFENLSFNKAESRKAKAEEKEETPEEDKSDLVMANVQNAVNVRAEADENSDKIGVLYVDCGGKIIERKNGWTKLKSGNLVGWAHDQYLVFDDEAKEKAEDVGNLIVTINSGALRVRKEPSEDAEVYGLLAIDDELEVIEDLEDWVSIEYKDKTGYISKDYVSVDFHIDSGESLEEIKAREKKEAEEKAKRTENRGAVAVGVEDDVLLAALIQCEAGNQPYEGQLAVGAVVMNRVRSGGYPNTISGVIYASGQFPPALNGKVARVAQKGVKDSCLQAARAAIAGETSVAGATRFRRNNGRDGIVIGNHVFW